jgi:hypothetical protein
MTLEPESVNVTEIPEDKDEWEDSIPEIHIPCRPFTIGERNYIEITLYDKKKYIVGFPDKRLLDAFVKNKYPYNFQPEDRTWQSFIGECRRRKMYALTKQVNRTRDIVNGKLKDIYWLELAFYGQDNQEKPRYTSRIVGVWRKPRFNKERNKDNDELETTGVDTSEKIFDFSVDVKDKNSIEELRYFIERANPHIQCNISPAIDAKSNEIKDFDGFALATFSELIEMGMKTGYTLEDIQAARGYRKSLNVKNSVDVR